MPVRIPAPNTQVVIQREGKLFSPPIGQEFAFTEDEVTEINKLSPGALQKIVLPEDNQPKVEKMTPAALPAVAEPVIHVAEQSLQVSKAK